MQPLQTSKYHDKTNLDVNMPLHLQTDSHHDVADLVSKLLNAITETGCETSHADILQALAITTALRMAMADAAVMHDANFSMDLLNIEIGADDNQNTQIN